MDKIIILSEKTDSITSDIMLWIIHYGNKAYRINRDDHNMEILFLSEEYVKIRTSYEIITINRGDYVWCRRSGLYSIFVTKEKNQDTLQKKIFHFQERRDIWQSFFHWIAAHCRFCENPLSSNVNKTDVLEIAKKEGLQIPDWIVTGEKKELIKFLDKHQKLAVKPFNTLNYSNNGYSIKSLTNCITNKNLENINDFFPPLIFQNYIEKKYELRSFLFNNKLYTMAIFSQKMINKPV